jgi:N4-gp56 family major capsid protein
MAMQKYGTVASRNLIRAEMKMLKHAEPIQVLTNFGDQKEQPLNKTDTIVFRRLKPFNATATEVPNITSTPSSSSSPARQSFCMKTTSRTTWPS